MLNTNREMLIALLKKQFEYCQGKKKSSMVKKTTKLLEEIIV